MTRLVKDRTVAAVVTAFVAVTALLIAAGPDVLSAPLPLNQNLAAYWLTMNAVLALIGIFTIVRNAARWRELWTWQETTTSRGIILVLAGGLLGGVGRAFGDTPQATVGSPVITLGILVLVYGTLRPPIRFELDRLALVESLRDAEQRFSLLIDQIEEYAIFSLDLRGNIESWNVGAERLKGYKAEEVIGKPFSMFYTLEDQRAGVPEKLLEIARKNGVAERTGWRVRKDGSMFWGDIILTLVRDGDGAPAGFVKIVRDVTHLENREPGDEVSHGNRS